MIGLGYNVLVIPKGEDLMRFHARGYAVETMPEEYVRRLAEAKTITVQHLLPSLPQEIEWPERKCTVLLAGTRGEAPQSHRDPKKPLQPAVPPGGMIVGSVLAERLGLKPGDKTVLLGKTFTVSKVHPPRGNADDVTAWIDLAEAQALLGKPGRINAILALSCFCAEATLDGISREVGSILDNQVQVVERTPQADARRAARARAAEHGEETLAAGAADREELRTERHALAAWIIPLIIAGCAVWVGLMAFTNARDRSTEVGILRAIGVRSGQVLTVFLARAVLVGVAGAAVGYAAGFAIGIGWDAHEAAAGESVGAAALFDPAALAAVLVAAPLLSAVASLLPAMMAAGCDPAVVLREE